MEEKRGLQGRCLIGQLRRVTHPLPFSLSLCLFLSLISSFLFFFSRIFIWEVNRGAVNGTITCTKLLFSGEKNLMPCPPFDVSVGGSLSSSLSLSLIVFSSPYICDTHSISSLSLLIFSSISFPNQSSSQDEGLYCALVIFLDLWVSSYCSKAALFLSPFQRFLLLSWVSSRFSLSFVGFFFLQNQFDSPIFGILLENLLLLFPTSILVFFVNISYL